MLQGNGLYDFRLFLQEHHVALESGAVIRVQPRDFDFQHEVFKNPSPEICQLHGGTVQLFQFLFGQAISLAVRHGFQGQTGRDVCHVSPRGESDFAFAGEPQSGFRTVLERVSTPHAAGDDIKVTVRFPLVDNDILVGERLFLRVLQECPYFMLGGGQTTCYYLQSGIFHLLKCWRK